MKTWQSELQRIIFKWFFKCPETASQAELKSVKVTDVFLMEKHPCKHGNAQHPEQWVLRNQET